MGHSYLQRKAISIVIFFLSAAFNVYLEEAQRDQEECERSAEIIRGP